MSPDAAERWSNPTTNHGSHTINSGDTLSAIAKRELGSSSRWREIKKPDGSAFTESEAGRLQIGQQVHLPGTSGSSNNRAGQPSHLQGMSADAAETWSGGTRTRSTSSIASSNTWNNALLNGTTVGTAVGAFVASRKFGTSVASRNSGSSTTPSNFDTSMASRNSSSSKASSNFAIGRITQRAWNEVIHVETKRGLPVLGAGGNTALPGEIQKHVIIKPQSVSAPQTRTLRVATTVGGAAIGSIVPGVGTAAGAIVGGIIGGVTGSEFGDDIEQGAEKAGQEKAGGAKKAWNELFG